MGCIGFTTPNGVNIDIEEFQAIGDYDLEKLFELSGPICRALGSGAIRPKLDDDTAHVTELIGDIRQSILKRRKDYYVGLKDQLWSTWGSGVHVFLDGHTRDGQGEKTMEHTFKVCGVTVVGTSDHMLDGVVEDYKTTSAFSGKRLNDAKIKTGDYFSEQPEWWEQLESYAALAYLTEEKVITSGRIWAFFRDWQRAQSYRYHSYPQEPIACFAGPPMPPPHEMAATLEGRAEVWASTCTLEEGFLPRCSDTWGANKEGLPRRCAEYCSVSSACTQYQQAVMARRTP